MHTEKDHQKNIRHIVRRPWEFLAVFLVLFFIIAVFLFAIDFYPEPTTDEVESDSSSVSVQVQADIVRGVIPQAHASASLPTPTEEPVVVAMPSGVEVPVRVVIEKIGVNTPISNPTKLDVASLDAELLKGAVRYPGSAVLGEMGTVFLFGHQSYLPVVKNKAFKAFNDLQNLKAGDIVKVYSGTAVYEYRVASVSLVKAEEAAIALRTDARRLVLSTCNSFGKKSEERYVVEADFVSKIAL